MTRSVSLWITKRSVDRKMQEIYCVERSLWLLTVRLLIIEVLLPNICLRFCVWYLRAVVSSFLLYFSVFFFCLIIYHIRWIKMNIFPYPHYTVGLTSCSAAATVWPTPCKWRLSLRVFSFTNRPLHIDVRVNGADRRQNFPIPGKRLSVLD